MSLTITGSTTDGLDQPRSLRRKPSLSASRIATRLTSGTSIPSTKKVNTNQDIKTPKRKSRQDRRDPGWPGHRVQRDRYRRRLHADRRRRARCRGHQGILDPLLGDPQPAAAGYSEADLACSVNGNNELAPGKGLFNEVLAENGKDSDGTSNNKACGPHRPPRLRDREGRTQNTGSTFADASNQYIGPNNAAMYPLKGAEFAIYKSNPNTDANATVVKTLTQANATDGILLERQRPEPRHRLLAGRDQGTRRHTPCCPSPSSSS